MGSFSRRSRLKLFAATYLAMARLAKRHYGNANHVWLVKRVLSFVGSRVVPFPSPRKISGVDFSGQSSGVLTGMDCKRPLIGPDKVPVKFGLVKPRIDSLQAAGGEYTVFDAVKFGHGRARRSRAQCRARGARCLARDMATEAAGSAAQPRGS